MSTMKKAANRPDWPPVSRLALAFVSLWVPLLVLALATGWHDSGGAAPAAGDSLLVEYVVNGSAISGPLSAQLILLALAVAARRTGRVGVVATAALGLMGALIAFQGGASALADHQHAPQAVGSIAGLGFFAFGIALLATAARGLLLPRQAGVTVPN